MKPVVSVFILITLMLSFCLTVPAGATLVQLNNGVIQHNGNIRKITEDMLWILDLNLFTNQTWLEQQQTINGLPITTPWRNWWMATESDINTLELKLPSDTINLFLPIFTIYGFDNTKKYLYTDIEWGYDDLYNCIIITVVKEYKSWNKYTGNIILNEYYPVNYVNSQSWYNYVLKSGTIGDWVVADASDPVSERTLAVLLFCTLLAMLAPESDRRKNKHHTAHNAT